VQRDSAVPVPSVVGAWRRRTARTAEPLLAPLSTDLLGSELRYYAVKEGRVWVSASVRALAGKLGEVTLHGPALAETLAFGLPLRDATVLAEVRSVPPHSTLHPDGTLTTNPGPRATRDLGDAVEATRLARAGVEALLAEEEARFAVHLVGFTGGKDSRILAALPKRDPARWHHLSISGRGDAEHTAAQATAERLGLAHYRWLEWTSGFLDGDGRAPLRHRRSADLANGLGAVSDFTLLRSAFEEHRGDALGRGADDEDVALWQGTLADGLFAATWLAPPARTLWDALAPRTGHLAAALAPAVHAGFQADLPFYRSNPYAYAGAGESDPGWFLRLYTRGRAYVCRALTCLDDVCPTQLNPYLHPALFDLALRLAPDLLAADAVRLGLLRGLGAGLDGPSAFGYRAPPYAQAVFRALTAEARACAALPAVVHPALVAAMRDGRFPALDEAAPAPAGAPAYRSHGEASSVKSPRDYEHLLTYAAFLNLLTEDGVALRPPR
jgi:hypothetical protein